MTGSLEWTRPEWWLALPIGIALLYAWWRAHAGLRLWRKLVDAELLEQLAGRAPESGARVGLGIAIAALALVCGALAGPLWRAEGASPQHGPAARIVVLDLSPSMDAIDVAPSRLQLARDATAALLHEASGAQLGVVVFGADAFSVAPLTSDAATLVHLLAGVRTGTVPRAGSRTDLGLDLARALLKKAGAARGDVILVGDGAGDSRTLDSARALADAGFPLSALAVGTAQGGPVRLASGAFARTEAGDILIARTDFTVLEQVAQLGGGRFQVLRPGGEMPRFSLRDRDRVERFSPPPGAPNESYDGGAWLALAALPFAALLFRRGWLAGLAALALAPAFAPPQAQAFDWQDLWRRTDQQAAIAFARGTPGETARALSRVDPDSPWHAMLLYRSGNYAEAAAQFAAHDTAVAHYNRGNSLALDGDLESAIAAYDAALARNPAMPDAIFNRALVRKALDARPMQPQDGAEGKRSTRPQGNSLAAARSRALAGGRDELPSDPRQPGATAGERARQGSAQDERARAQPDTEHESKAGDRLGADERERLENLLSKVPNDPGSLLANRFAQQLRARGSLHHDAGARW